ncbi:MAG TPA: YHS domain-containing protein [Syntrophales bacterium]|nr:YHS domain-containing protein [Syntrophales bacterium]
MFGLIRLAIILLILYLLYRLFRWIFLPGGKVVKPLPREDSGSPREDLVEDPVCHTYLPASQARKARFDEQDLYFCSEECLEKYRRELEGEQEE